MGVIAFGDAELVYSIRLSQKARKKRIEITPYSITIIAPESASEEDVVAFMQKKAKAVFIAQGKLRAKNRSHFQEKDQYFSGGKVSFRGRRLAVRVEYWDGDKPRINYQSRFLITLPKMTSEEDRESVVGSLVKDWLHTRLLEDSREIAANLGRPLKLAFKSIRVREQKHIWATCGKDQILYINRQLIKVPRRLLEYVIAHELAHLAYRNHSPKFWTLVDRMVPDHRVYQDMLDRW